MNINNIKTPSFKAYIPVTYYAKHPDKNEYVPIVKNENIKKCQGFVVRNLNGTAKNLKNDKFIKFYRDYDSDYRRNPKVMSVYDKDSPLVYMVTGRDVDVVKNMAKPVGIAKGQSIDRCGRSKSFESANAAKNYFSNVKSFLRSSCRRLKSNDGQNLSLRVYFDPKYGVRSQKLQGFDFVNAIFVKEES